MLLPIVLIVVGVVEIHKLKKTVRELGSRIGALESRDRGVVAPAAPVQAATSAPVSQAVSHTAQPNRAARRPAAGCAATSRSGTRAAQGVPSVPPPLPPPLRPLPPPPVPRVAKPIDWEAFFGVKLFAWIGGFVLFLGIVFLVKYSFENNLITPAMRVVIGTVVGLALIVTGWLTATRRLPRLGPEPLRDRRSRSLREYFCGPCFLSSDRTRSRVRLHGDRDRAAFFLAVRMNAQVIVVLGLLGGFLTPVLLSTGVDNPTALFGYIAVLNIGVAAVALRKRWDYLILLAAAGTVLIEYGWAFKFFESPKANIAFAVFLGFEAQFLAIFAAQRRTESNGELVGVRGGRGGIHGAGRGLLFSRISDARSPARFPFHFRLPRARPACLLWPSCERDWSRWFAPAAGLVVFVFLASWTRILPERRVALVGPGRLRRLRSSARRFRILAGIAERAVSKSAAWQSYAAAAAARAHLPLRCQKRNIVRRLALRSRSRFHRDRGGLRAPFSPGGAYWP